MQLDAIQFFRYEPTKFSNNVKVLIGFVNMTITGHVQSESFSKCSKNGGFVSSVTIPIPTPPVPTEGTPGVRVAAGANFSTEESHQSQSDGTGVVGIGLSLLRLELTSNSKIKIRAVHNIKRVDTPELKQAMAWAQMGRLTLRMPTLDPRPTPAQQGFVFGVASNEDNSPSTYSENVACTARNTQGTVLGRGLIADSEVAEDLGNVMLEVLEPVDPNNRRGTKSLWPEFVFLGFHKSIHVFYPAKVSKLSEMYAQLKKGEVVTIKGYTVVSMTPTVPCDISEFLPIHYKPRQGADLKPGAILRHEGEMEVLIPLCALDIKYENKDIITASSKGWRVLDSVHYVKPEEVEEYRLHDYLPLDKSEADPLDVDIEAVANGSIVVMGRQILVDGTASDQEGGVRQADLEDVDGKLAVTQQAPQT